MANPSEDGGAPTQVAAHLMPVWSFDAACAQVIDYLAQVTPMGLWAVMRVNEGTQLVLSSTGDTYPVQAGDVFPFSTSFCRRMVSGDAPRIAPDVAQVPA